MANFNRTFFLTDRKRSIIEAFGHELKCHKCGKEIETLTVVRKQGSFYYHFSCILWTGIPKEVKNEQEAWGKHAK